MDRGQVIAVAMDDEHRFSKKLIDKIHILAGLGVRATRTWA